MHVKSVFIQFSKVGLFVEEFGDWTFKKNVTQEIAGDSSGW